MLITITIDTGNDAFVESPEWAVRRVMAQATEKAATLASEEPAAVKLLDPNGNFCGYVVTTESK